MNGETKRDETASPFSSLRPASSLRAARIVARLSTTQRGMDTCEPWKYCAAPLLGEFLKVSEWISAHYPWSEAEASWFVLTDEYPHIPPLTATVESGPTPSITLTAAPYVSATTVRDFYLSSWSGTHPQAITKQELCESSGSSEVRSGWRQAVKLRGGRWPKLQELWNDTYPKGRYVERGGLRKAYEKSIQAHY